jgi:hypothetical protein
MHFDVNLSEYMKAASTRKALWIKAEWLHLFRHFDSEQSHGLLKSFAGFNS